MSNNSSSKHNSKMVTIVPKGTPEKSVEDVEEPEDESINGGDKINIFSILQDAYMYRGYNRFLFFVFYMLTLLLLLKSLTYNNEDAYMKRRVTKAFLANEDVVDSPSTHHGY